MTETTETTTDDARELDELILEAQAIMQRLDWLYANASDLLRM